MLLCHSTCLFSTVRSMDTIKAMYVNGYSKYLQIFLAIFLKHTVTIVVISAENLNSNEIFPH